jgi:choline kinase
MRAIILSAGQGTRLLPRTAHTPKCLLPVRGHETVLQQQLRTLVDCGVRDAQIVVGFGAEQVEAFLRERPVPGIRTQTLRNPLFAVADNLVSAWLGAREAQGDFILLNGDTLVDGGALERLLAEASAPVTLTVNRKQAYDADDMKVSLDGQRVCAVSKSLDSLVDAESIGLLLFRGEGPRLFREALEACLAEPEGLASYYLAAVDRLARAGVVRALALDGEWWQEIDTSTDWALARAALASRRSQSVTPRASAPQRSGKRRRRVAALALACAGLLCIGGKPAVADERAAASGSEVESELEPEPPKPKLELRGEFDDWLYGPSLQVAPSEGRLRPYVVGSGGVRSDVLRLGIEDPTNRFLEEPYAGRVGGGLGLHLDDHSSVAVEGSTIVQQGPVATETDRIVGVKLRVRF